MLRIAVCDDDQSEAARTASLLQEYQQRHPGYDLQARTFFSASQLFATLEDGWDFDIYLLDILLPECSGIELARTLRRNGSHAIIIFLTSSRDYSLDAFSVKAMQYLLKPISGENLFAALDDAVALRPRANARMLSVSTTSGTAFVHFSLIAFVEYAHRILYVHRSDGIVIQSRGVRCSFDVAAQPLLEDPRFIRPHQSFIVNMFHVASLSPKELVMLDAKIVPMSRSRFPEIKRLYLTFLSSNSKR